MAVKRHLWYTDLALTTLERSGWLSTSQFALHSKFQVSRLPQGLEEAPVVHGLSPDRLI